MTNPNETNSMQENCLLHGSFTGQSNAGRPEDKKDGKASKKLKQKNQKLAKSLKKSQKKSKRQRKRIKELELELQCQSQLSSEREGRLRAEWGRDILRMLVTGDNSSGLMALPGSLGGEAFDDGE